MYIVKDTVTGIEYPAKTHHDVLEVAQYVNSGIENEDTWGYVQDHLATLDAELDIAEEFHVDFRDDFLGIWVYLANE